MPTDDTGALLNILEGRFRRLLTQIYGLINSDDAPFNREITSQFG